MLKKIITLAVAMVTLSSVAFAEQPMAEQYRQMFKSGTFYVEYIVRSYSDYREAEMTKKAMDTGMFSFLNVFGNNKVTVGNNLVHVIANENNHRLVSTIHEEKKSGGFGGIFAGLGSSKKKSTVPGVMYQDGNYYRFSTSYSWKTTFFGAGRKSELKVFMLPASEVKADYLNPDEGWNTIEHDLALPDELSVFAWEDRFHVAKPGEQAPQFKESIKLSEEKQEYDCDRYVSDIKNIDNKVVAQNIYDLLYQNGKLVVVRTYFSHKGVTTFVGDIAINKLEGTLPENAFAFPQKVPIYAAGTGDANDLLGNKVQIGTLGADK